jgi:hypothetical protein
MDSKVLYSNGRDSAAVQADATGRQKHSAAAGNDTAA